MNVPSKFMTMSLLPLLACASATARGEDLDISASTPDVTITARSTSRNALQLPALEFDFDIDARCPAGLLPASVSLSIADTRVTNDEPGNDWPLKMSVRIPAEQIAPVPIARFCVDGDEAENLQADTLVRIPSVLSAQAAVLCAGEAAQQMLYASESLNVVVRCERPAEIRQVVAD
jgi:hypothetical protein